MDKKVIRAPFAVMCLFVAALLVGCGKESVPQRVDDAVDSTEEALTSILLGNANEVGVTGLAPPDKPLLVKDVHDTVYVAADENAFVTLSRGSITLAGVKEIEQRVVKDVDHRLHRHGFSARGTTFPAPTTLTTEPKALIATLVPITQETGSPRDRARGKGKTLVLIHLTISDAASGTVLSARDYYSGNDVKRDDDKRREDGRNPSYFRGDGRNPSDLR